MNHIEWLRELNHVYEEADEVADELERLQRENEELRNKLITFNVAVDHVARESGKTRRTFSTSEGWAMLHKDRLLDLECAEEELAALKRENEELRKRLEIDPRHSYDGIDCRDETIKQLDELTDRQSKHISDLAHENDELRGICRDVYEVWAGSEGMPIPETAPEAYLKRLVEQMRDEAKRGLSALKAQSTEQPVAKKAADAVFHDRPSYFQESTEPVAWAVKQEYARAEDSDEIVWESIWDHPSFANDHVNQQYEMQSDGYLPKAKRSVVPLYPTPPTATALVEDFKRRAIETVKSTWNDRTFTDKALDLIRSHEYQICVNIESLPLINDFNQGEKHDRTN